jgi:translocation and assembly module TamB
VELNAKFDSFPVRKQGVLIGRADAKAKVQLDSKPTQTDVDVHMSGVNVNLTGNTSADVQSLEEHPEIVVAGEERKVEEEKPDPNAPPSVINVKVRSDDSIWVKRDDFAVRMRANLDVHVENGTSSITGEVRLERGYIALLGQQFDVKDGRVVFTGGQTVNPSLELTAQSTSPAGKVVTVEVTGFVSAPVLAFDVDGKAANAGEAIIALTGHGDTGTQQSPEDQLASAAIGMTTGLLSLGARREFGDFIPMLSIDQSTQDTRVRAGFEADKLIPSFMRGFVRGAYVEGIVSTGDGGQKGGENTSGNAQTGVLLELQLPADLVWAGKYGPGQTWSLDLDWRP